MQTLTQIEHAAWPRQIGGARLAAEPTFPAIRLEEDGAGRFEDSRACVPAPHLSQQKDRPAVLLQITGDLSLGRTRAEVLKRAGLDVLTVSEVDAFAYVDTWDLAVALFCQTVRRERAIAICDVLHERPRPFTVRLTFTPHLDRLAFDAVLSSPVEPTTLVQEAQRWKQSFYSGVGMR